MKIIETNLKFKTLSPIGKIVDIVLHHSVSGDVSASTIHQWHLNNGWSGCGYHFIVRQNGTVERGRPENFVGAHVSNKNTGRIGVCFVGDFDKNTMNKEQIKGGKELIKYLISKYNCPVKKHRDFGGTACPGKNFPFDELVNGHISIPSNPSNSNNSKKLWELSVSGEVVKELQISIGVKVDGYFGNDTLKKCPLLKLNSRGNTVKAMQRRLNQLGYNTNGIDGVFGNATLTSIKSLQSKARISVDGIVGNNTWKALYRK